MSINIEEISQILRERVLKADAALKSGKIDSELKFYKYLVIKYL
jgi:hypothetical protein